MMRINYCHHVSYSLPKAWEKACDPRFLFSIGFPLLRMAYDKKKARIELGAIVEVRLWLFCVIPLGKYQIEFLKVDPQTSVIRTSEKSALLRRWNHTLTLAPEGDDGTLIIHEIVFEPSAGYHSWLHPFYHLLYRYRALRWKFGF